MASNEAGLQWHPVEYVTEPRGNYVQVMRDYWWVTNDNGEIAIYNGRAPQCNRNEDIARHSWLPDATGVRLIPLAFMPIDPRDYA